MFLSKNSPLYPPPLPRFNIRASMPSKPSAVIRQTMESMAPVYLTTKSASLPSMWDSPFLKSAFMPTGNGPLFNGMT